MLAGNEISPRPGPVIVIAGPVQTGHIRLRFHDHRPTGQVTDIVPGIGDLLRVTIEFRDLMLQCRRCRNRPSLYGRP